MKLFNTQVQQVKEQFLHPLPGLSADGVCVCHVVTLVHIPHVSVIVLYYHRFQSISMLIMEIALCWWMVHVCQHVYMSFQVMAVRLSLTLVLVTPFHSISKFLWHALSIESDSATAVYFTTV